MKVKRTWSKASQIQNRFENLDCRINNLLKSMPEIENIQPENELQIFNLNQIAYLEEYKKDLNETRSLSMLSLNKATLSVWKKQPHFIGVVNKINEAYAEAVLMDRKTIAGWSVEILRDIHNQFKKGDSRVAPALASMAGNMLRASGNFGETEGVKQSQVLIQINTHAPTNEKTQKEVKETITAKPSIHINLKTKNNVDTTYLSLL